MFQSFSEFIHYIEALPPLNLTDEQKIERLLNAKKWIRSQRLVPQVPVVTVTGTNGKGSTVKALAEILVQHGLNISTFTSPHLFNYTERFTYNLQAIDEQTLLRLANTLSSLTDLSQWNFFTILFFIHLLWCQELFLDCVILEVGLGGRLDPTNALDASLVILTQVALDHTDLLGHTREAIGLEKMGLLREDLPLVCGDPHPPITVLAAASQLHCPVYQLNQQFGFCLHAQQWDLWFEHELFRALPLPMLHLNSLSCALQAVKLLFPTISLTQLFMETVLPIIHLSARYQQLIYKEIEFIVDVSHNPAAATGLAEFIQLLPGKQTYAIFGAKATKDIPAIIANMKNVIDDWWLVPVHGIDGADTKTLATFFEPFAIKPKTSASIEDAIKKLILGNNIDTRIIVFGSFHVAGPALAVIQGGVN